jgi:hypothetical protein
MEKGILKKILRKLAQPLRGLWTTAMHHPKALFLVGLILGSYFGHTVSVLMMEAKYRIGDQSVQLLGEVNYSLANKLKLDKNVDAYRFNANSVTPEMTGETDPTKVAALLASQKQQTGGGGKDSKNLYALDLPIDPSQGTKVYDVNSKTSFKIIPEFSMGAGRSEDGRVVYPLDEGGQAIYTVKANGIKEDIVLQKSRGNELSFTYKLDLPKTLEARLDDRGNLGIYSVDPAVSSAIAGALQNGASSTDSARLNDVLENGTKDFLTYLIPAPTIMQSGDHPRAHKAKAIYKLNGDQLMVESKGLESLTYPVSIDPSVVVTSTTDFTTGDSEGNISFDTDAISRAGNATGSLDAWSSSTVIPGGLYLHGSVAYNGFLYLLGGRPNGAASPVATVYYAPINTNGTIGAWATTTSMLNTRDSFEALAYGGFLYAIGGQTSGSSVDYAPINTDGTIGSWTSTNGLTSGLTYGHSAVAYNGYFYTLGGGDNLGNFNNIVQYTTVNADGTLGVWTTTTAFTNARNELMAVAYNGYMYISGGSGGYADVQYAPIASNGTVGTWVATTSLPTPKSGAAIEVDRGYLYAIGGYDSSIGNFTSSVYSARINADGKIGTWITTSALPDVRTEGESAIYNGVIYQTGGQGAFNSDTNTVYIAATQTLATATPPFNMSSWSPTTILGAGSGSATAKATTRQLHSSVAYNGYLYIIGGQAGTTPTTTVHYAPINANGTLGAWVVSTNALPLARHSHKSVVVNGYIYVFGGTVSGAASNTILYSLIGANGLNGTWSSVTPTGIASQNQAVAEYNGYLYVLGGGTGTNTVHYSLIGANGLPGTWTATTVLPDTLYSHMAVAYNGYLYAMGGNASTGTNNNTYYAPINANGTVGTWNTTTSLGFLSNGGDSVHAYQGYLIINSDSQLRDGSFTEYDAVMRYAKINANGTIGSWSVGTTYTTDRAGKGSALYNGFIYTTGGTANSVVQGDTLYAQITFDFPGMSTYGTTGTWQSSTAINLGLYGHTSVAYNNYIYAIGGYGGGVYRSEVRYAPINANGTIGTWVTSPNTMSALRFNSGVAVYNGYLYMTGGQQGPGAFSNTVEYAKINADGSVGTWTTSGNAFTTARYGHVSVAYNGKLYIIGGGDSANVALSDVKYATINTDGSIGTWSDTTATTAARDTDGFIYGGRIYILGGVNGTTYSNTVRYATINANGTLGTWTTSGNVFATARSRLAATATNGYMYLSGGGTSGLFGDLQYAQINTDGSISAWKTSNSRSAVSGAPTTFAYQTMVAYKGVLYELGGIDGANTPQAPTYMTSLNVAALTGTYLRRIDLGQASTVNSIVMNGILPVDQSSNVLFRAAGSDGIYGAWTLPSSLVGTPLTNIRYVIYKVVLDDSTSSSIFATTGRSTVNDVTLDYTVPVVNGLTTDIRLKNNKYFDSSGVLQPLQTQ